MSRSTRSGTTFSPYDLIIKNILASVPPDQIIRTDISLDKPLEEALASELRYANNFDQEGVDGEWEDESDIDETSSLGEAGPPHFDSPPPSPPPSRVPSPSPKPTTSTAATDSQSPEENRRIRQAKAKVERRKLKRQAAAASSTPFDYKPGKNNDQSYRTLPPEATQFAAETLPFAGGGGWIGAREWVKKTKQDKKRSKGWGSRRRTAAIRQLQRLEELLAEGFRYIKYDGDKPLFILDRDGRLIAVFVGKPDDPEWDKVISDLTDAMTKAREEAVASGELPIGDDRHRRGNYSSFTEGVTLGGGPKKPGNFVNPPKIRKIIRQLMGKKCTRRVCGFQSSALTTYAPKLCRDVIDDLKPLFKHHPNLRHNFKNSIYPIVTFNCGPRTATYQHRDFKNPAGSWCAITAAGVFDHTKGGHLYLRQLKLIVEFPSGSTALIPSAIVDHGNTPLQPGETRCSVTQYVSGALSRWVKYGFRSGKDLVMQDRGRALKDEVDGPPGERARRALELFSKADELAADRAAVFGI
ncbi:hypothetical protein C8J57DRAFT_1110457 [Mycena rebaudengoi]|nr:hypothetical protein C8J57DRAFT_1110457 [Mycena rebaudengoi]